MTLSRREVLRFVVPSLLFACGPDFTPRYQPDTHDRFSGLQSGDTDIRLYYPRLIERPAQISSFDTHVQQFSL